MKIIKIETCDMCPYFHKISKPIITEHYVTDETIVCTAKIGYGILKVIDEEWELGTIEIPKWCPLKNEKK